MSDSPIEGAVFYIYKMLFLSFGKLGEVHIKELIEKIRAGALVCTSSQTAGEAYIRGLRPFDA